MADNVHYTVTVTKPEALYHLRLYAIPSATEFTLLHHLTAMPQAVAIPSEAVSFLPERSISYGSELFQDTLDFAQLKLKLAADNIFFPIVAALRDPSKSIWIEVVIEQFAEGLPDIPPIAMCFPRQKRLWFWGKLVARDFSGDVDWQDLGGFDEPTDEIIFNQEHPDHIGSIDLTFAHWLPLRLLDNPKGFLDDFRSTWQMATTDKYTSLAWLLYKLCRWICPADLFVLTDHRMDGVQASVDIDVGVPLNKGPHFEIGWLLRGDTTDSCDLYNIGFRTRGTAQIGGNFSVLLAKEGEIAYDGERSWYAYKTLGEFFAGLCEELQMQPQIEMPTFEETAPLTGIWNGFRLGNTAPRHLQYWSACARWYFNEPLARRVPVGVSIDNAWSNNRRGPSKLLSIYTRPLGKPRYFPAAVWVQKAKVDEVEYENQATPIFRSFSYNGSDDPVTYEGGIELSKKTIFEFVGKTAGGADDPRGNEFVILDANNDWLEYVREVGHIYINEVITTGGAIRYQGVVPQLFDAWGKFIAWRIAVGWTGRHAIVEYEAEGVGIEPFGASVPISSPFIKSFGLLDLGEFPIFRQQQINVGLLYEPSDNNAKPNYRTFELFEIVTIPGTEEDAGTLKLRFIERSIIDSAPIIIVENYGRNSIDPPNVSMGGPVTHDSVSGIVEIAGTVTPGSTATIRRVEIYAGGALIGKATLTGFDYSFSLDTTDFEDGAHAIMAKVIDGNDLEGTAFVAVTINNIADVDAAVAVRKNSTGGDIGLRRRINFIEGTNIALTVADDAASNEIDVTIAATGGGSYTDEQAQDAVGSILADTATIDATYNDATPQITFDVKDGSITAAKIATDAVETAKIKDGAVTYAKLVASAATQTTPANPAGTTSSTGVMMGMGATTTIAPLASGRILIIISGTIKNSAGDNGAKAQIRYGTGVAPVNGAALTGTAVGGLVQCNLVVSGSGDLPPISPFSLNAIVTGLSVGTTYWIDASLAAITGGTATITNISISIVEM